MNKLKNIANVFYGIVIVFLATVAGLVAASALDIPNGFRLFTVQSGSMEPAIHTGSLVIDQPADTYTVGDIITFKNPEDGATKRPKITTTHRITGVISENGITSYQTKGDANDAPEGNLKTHDLVIGKVLLSLPLLGYPIAFAKTKEGLILLVVIPATIIIYSEIMSIKNEILKIWRKKHEKTEKTI